MEIKLETIKILKNTRTDLTKSDLAELMTDIRENGLLHPIGVWEENGEYFLAYGHRRFMAMKKLGRKSLVVGDEVKILKGKLNAEDFLVLNLVENLHRVDNTPIELAKGCQQLKDLGLSNSEIASRLSVPKTRIQIAFNLLKKVPQGLQANIGYTVTNTLRKGGKIPASVMNRIANARIGTNAREKLFEAAQKEDLTLGDVDLLGALVSRGIPFETARKEMDKYTRCSVHIVLNRELLEQTKLKSTELVREILEGKRKPIKGLVY